MSDLQCALVTELYYHASSFIGGQRRSCKNTFEAVCSNWVNNPGSCLFDPAWFLLQNQEICLADSKNLHAHHLRVITICQNLCFRLHLCPEMHTMTKMADLAKELHN